MKVRPGGGKDETAISFWKEAGKIIQGKTSKEEEPQV